MLYAPEEIDHHHLTCVDCGKTEILKSSPMNSIVLPKNEVKSLHMLFHTLEFFGFCKECYNKKKWPKGKYF